MNKFIGGMLLIAGTSIGGGMLALPMTSSGSGFVSSCITLLLIWFIMLVASYLVLEVNLCCPSGASFMSMAGLTFGRPGKIIIWFVYLMILYSVVAAYMVGGQDLVQAIFGYFFHYSLSKPLSLFLFIALFSMIVIPGIRTIDFANQAIMLLKMGSYIALVFFLQPYVRYENFAREAHLPTPSAVLAMITSFSSSLIIPSLRHYFKDNIRSLRWCIFIGSLLPLIFYLLWEMVIFGVIKESGSYSLHRLAHTQNVITDLVSTLTHYANTSIIARLVSLFTSVCVLTAFLATSLCLADFWTDTLSIKTVADKKPLFIYVYAYLPPLLTVLYYPTLFKLGISYAGVFCALMLILFPILMAAKLFGRSLIQECCKKQAKNKTCKC